MNSSPVKIGVFIAIVAFATISQAADSLAYKYPRAVLVQLRSEHNRIAALTKDKRYQEVQEVTNDAQEIRSKMISDFTDHFHYCPVYYYIDTNVDLIRMKKFDGVLLNADGTMARNLVINSNSKDYVIVYYGYALSQGKRQHVVDDPDKYAYDPDSRPGKGLVVLNDQFLQIDNFYKYGYDELIFKLKKKSKKYFYVSRHFDMEYFPFAHLFEENMGDRYARHRIEPGSSGK